MRKWAINVACVAIIFAGGLAVGHNTNVYWGLNKGVTWGTVGGCEFVGKVGCWLGDQN